jgi:hypothetical protein
MHYLEHRGDVQRHQSWPSQPDMMHMQDHMNRSLNEYQRASSNVSQGLPVQYHVGGIQQEHGVYDTGAADQFDGRSANRPAPAVKADRASTSLIPV